MRVLAVIIICRISPNPSSKVTNIVVFGDNQDSPRTPPKQAQNKMFPKTNKEKNLNNLTFNRRMNDSPIKRTMVPLRGIHKPIKYNSKNAVFPVTKGKVSFLSLEKSHKKNSHLLFDHRQNVKPIAVKLEYKVN